MNSKERVKAVLNNEIPDKVPWGEWAVDFDTVEKIVGHETLYRAKGKSQFALWGGRRDEVVQSWKEDAIEFFRKMDCFDVINVAAMASSVVPPEDYEFETPKKIADNTWEFLDGTVVKYSEITADITKVYDPSVGKKRYTTEEFEGEPIITPPDESCFEVVDAVIAAFDGGRFFMGPSGDEVGIHILGGSFDEGGGGFEHGLIQYIDNPETVKASIRYEAAKNSALDRYYIRPGQDSVGWGQDFSSNSGPFISPAMFREFVLPGIKTRVDSVHSYGIPVMKHCCGNNEKLLDMFSEAGYDAYQSIQRSAGMDPADIKARYGDKFVAWGGISVENLVSGTPGDIKKEVVHAMETFKPGGRYIFGSTHSIAVGTKYENFMTMVDEFVKRREY